jgi:hypothetical protein
MFSQPCLLGSEEPQSIGTSPVTFSSRQSSSSRAAKMTTTLTGGEEVKKQQNERKTGRKREQKTCNEYYMSHRFCVAILIHSQTLTRPQDATVYVVTILDPSLSVWGDEAFLITQTDRVARVPSSTPSTLDDYLAVTQSSSLNRATLCCQAPQLSPRLLMNDGSLPSKRRDQACM